MTRNVRIVGRFTIAREKNFTLVQYAEINCNNPEVKR